MGKIQVITTSKNISAQKKSIHFSSSAVFMGVYNPENGIDTEISLLNHFILKRNVSHVVAKFELRDLKGTLIRSFNININKKSSYSIRLGEYFKTLFIGSIYIFFKSKENLAVPFCAVMCAIKSRNSVCGLHTYGRRLEKKELGSNIDLTETVETGWTIRDSDKVKSFAVLHGGEYKLKLTIKLEIYNYIGKLISIRKKFILESFGTLIIFPQELGDNIVKHLQEKKGQIKVYIKGLKGVFPRMLCGNFLFRDNQTKSLLNADEIQFTHTNFDFSTIEQPDAECSYGYFNQPLIHNGYGMVYPVETNKAISINGRPYYSNSMHKIKINKMSQVKILAENDRLPSRFVAAVIGNWKGKKLESECSTGTFTKDYLKIPCHWHWGLLKPGFEKGKSTISIIMNRFDRDKNLSRKLKLRIFNEEKMILERYIEVDGNLEINSQDFLNCELAASSIWYVLTGDSLEDLSIYSTFFPEKKSGFVEHAF